MDKRRLILSRVRRRIPWLILSKIITSLTVLVFAVTISVNVTNYQAEIGGAFNVNNKLIATDKGFSSASVNSTSKGTGSCGGNVTFTVTMGTVANTALTANDYVYDVQVAVASTSTSVNTCYKVSFSQNTSSGTTPFGPLYIATPASLSNLQPLDAKFDINSASLPVSPFSFQVGISCVLGTCP